MSRVFLPVSILALLLTACSKPLPPQYVGYQNFRLEKASLSASVLASDIKLYNPNDYELKLKSTNLDVYFNDKFLGNSTLDSLIVLPGKDTTIFPLRLTAAAQDILRQSAQVLLNPNVKLRITGHARAGRGGIYINVPINYEGTQRIDLRQLVSSYQLE